MGESFSFALSVELESSKKALIIRLVQLQAQASTHAARN